MDASSWAAAMAAVVAVISSIFTYRASKSATEVNQDGNRIKWVQQAREESIDARKRAEVAESKVDDAERRLNACNVQLRNMEIRMMALDSRERYLTARLRYVIQMIHDPYQTLEGLRQRVPVDFVSGSPD